jgi:hypothetical protein
MLGSNGAAAAAAAAAPAVAPGEKVFVTRTKSGKRQVVKKEDEIAFLNMMEELLWRTKTASPARSSSGSSSPARTVTASPTHDSWWAWGGNF